MRLIDADALMENYGIKSATKYGNQTAEQLHNSYSTMMLYEIADMIEDAPTIDAEPVRHGRWILKVHDNRVNYLWTVTAYCSECCDEEKEIWSGYFPGVPDQLAHDVALQDAKQVKLSDYCPNCGAKMGEEVE